MPSGWDFTVSDVRLHERLYDICKAAFDEALSRSDAYDRKAQILFGVSGVILAFMVGRVEAVVSHLGGPRELAFLMLGSYALAVFSLVAAIVLGLLSIMLRRYRTYPLPTDVLREFQSSKDMREVDLLASMSQYFAENTVVNDESNKRRTRFLEWGMKSLVAAVVFVLVFLGGLVATVL